MTIEGGSQLKIGDIVVNPWVSKEFNGKLNAMYATIYLGNNTTLDYKLRKHTWTDRITRSDNEREWKVIGHCDLRGWIYEQILKAVEPPKEE